MKITVISGTEKKGVTCHLKELFLSELPGADITEFDLPQACPGFCCGCTACFQRGETYCKDAAFMQKIEAALCKADLLVFVSPVYVFHATAAMKNLLDHFAYRWMVHRPHPSMFGKRAVILTQCIGAGGKSAVKDIRDSLSWWGISEIGVFSMPLMEDIVWDHLSEHRKALLTSGIRKLGQRFARKNYETPAHTSLLTKIKFLCIRKMQQSIYRSERESLDASYWHEQGFLGSVRPWKH